MRKKRGSLLVESTVVFSLVLMMLLIIYLTSLGQIKAESEMVSDDLVSSELAAFKNIDKANLGASANLNEIVISEPEEAFQTFKKHLKLNLNIDDSFYPRNKFNFIKSKVDILVFKIYNVRDNKDVEIYSYENGHFTKEKKANGRNVEITPKGNKVENTTIYAKIGYKINPIFKEKKYVISEEEVDITKD